MASLELKGIPKIYGSTPILDGIDLTLDAREFIALLGPSGSGKSTPVIDGPSEGPRTAPRP